MEKTYLVTMVWSEPDYGYDEDWTGGYTEFDDTKEIEASSADEAILKYAKIDGMELSSDAIKDGVYEDGYCKIIAEEIKIKET